MSALAALAPTAPAPAAAAPAAPDAGPGMLTKEDFEKAIKAEWHAQETFYGREPVLVEVNIPHAGSLGIKINNQSQGHHTQVVDFATDSDAFEFWNNSGVQKPSFIAAIHGQSCFDLTKEAITTMIGTLSATRPLQVYCIYPGKLLPGHGGGAVGTVNAPDLQPNVGVPASCSTHPTLRSGRWSAEEHAEFLACLAKYGRRWTEHAKFIRRNTQSIKSHYRAWARKDAVAADVSVDVEGGKGQQPKAAAARLKQLFHKANSDDAGSVFADMCFRLKDEVVKAHKCVMANVSSTLDEFVGQLGPLRGEDEDETGADEGAAAGGGGGRKRAKLGSSSSSSSSSSSGRTMREVATGEILMDDILDLTIEALRAFVFYCYCGEIDDGTIREHARSLLAVAHRYQVLDLYTLCEGRLCETATVEDCLRLLSLATIYDAKQLKDKCWNLIRQNSAKLLVQPDFIAVAQQNKTVWAELTAELSRD